MAKTKGNQAPGYPSESNGPSMTETSQQPAGNQQNRMNNANNKKGNAAQNKGGSNAR
jgi:hypothetical protein